jgi:hypothetical protein
VSKQEVSLNSLNIHKVPSLSLWKEQYNVVNGINENDLVIISPQNLEDGVFLDLKDYDLYEKTGNSVISDLTGTTWTFDDILNTNIDTESLEIFFTFQGATYNDYSLSIDGEDLYYYRMSGMEVVEEFEAYNSYEEYWQNNNYKTITFTSGDDLSNQTFISWLSNNATNTSSGNITTTRELWRKNVTPSESGVTYTKIGSVLDLIQGPSIKSITIPASWSGSGPYYKTITSLITGYTITNKSKFDIQVDSTTINQLLEDGVQALYINNDNKVVKIYAIGAAPTQSITIQISIQETI